jgi:thymidylate synthase (FAD)
MNKDLIGKRVPFLDHGYVELIDYLGSDVRVVQSARQSFGEGEYENAKRNQALINYLIEHRHTTPLEMPVLCFKLKMPIFVARQHARHRTSSTNEYSLRYANCKGDYYLPPLDRFCERHKWNHQGSGEPLSQGVQLACRELLAHQFESQWETYQKLLNAGVSNEIARCALGVNYYTEMVWQVNLHNLFHYLKLRNDPHAQYEIQQMAEAMEGFVAELFPMCYDAYLEYIKHSVTFSRSEVEIVRDHVNNSVALPKEVLINVEEYFEEHSPVSKEDSSEILDYLSSEIKELAPDQIQGSTRRAEAFKTKIGIDVS